MHSTDTIQIILVEDNQDDAELFLRVLKKRSLNEKTLHLTNGEEALKIFFPGNSTPSTEKFLPKLIILDIKMPKVDGFTVLEKIKSDKDTRFIPVVIFSSSKEEKDIIKAYEMGANCFVEKPMEYDDFVTTVEKIIDFWININATFWP